MAGAKDYVDLEIQGSRFGVEYVKARQVSTGRTVFVKRAPVETKAAERFAHEAVVLVQFSHPRVVLLIDSAPDALVTEFVEGSALSRYVDEKNVPLSIAALATVAQALLEALAHVHGRGWVHADLSPSNVLVDLAGNVKVIDFGSASSLAGPSQALSAAQPHTPRYAAPEQLLGERPDARSDLYSVGKILSDLLPRRRLPWWRLGAYERSLRAFTARLTARAPVDRYHSASTALAALDVMISSAVRRVGARDLAALAHGVAPTRGRTTLLSRLEKLGHRSIALAAFGAAFVIGVLIVEGAPSFAAPPTPAGALSESLGYLLVVAHPWAEVWVDGEHLETTPFATPLPLSVGTHYVKLENPGFSPREKVVVVKAHETQTWTESFAGPKP